MKYTLKAAALSLLVLSSGIKAEEGTCPNWPAVLIQKNVAGKLNKDISIKLAKELIKDEKLSGNREMQISSEFTEYVEIKGNEVEVSLINKNKGVYGGPSGDEQWTKLATITQTEIVGDKVCHNITLESDIAVSEITKSFRPDCMFLPKWMCGKENQNMLKLAKKINGKEYYTTSLTGIVIYK